MALRIADVDILASDPIALSSRMVQEGLWQQHPTICPNPDCGAATRLTPGFRWVCSAQGGGKRKSMLCTWGGQSALQGSPLQGARGGLRPLKAAKMQIAFRDGGEIDGDLAAAIGVADKRTVQKYFRIMEGGAQREPVEDAPVVESVVHPAARS